MSLLFNNKDVFIIAQTINKNNKQFDVLKKK